MYRGSNDHVNNAIKAGRKRNQKLKLLKEERIKKYSVDPKRCHNCNVAIEYDRRFNKFCSQSCSAIFTNTGRLMTDETKNKIGKSLSISPRIVKCVKCQEDFVAKNKRQTVCSRECNRKHKTQAEKIKQSATMKARVAAGIHKGWQSRKIRSYAEKFFEKVLLEHNVYFDVEYKIGKRELGFDDDANYFLDFYIPKYNLDLEIDGKQHEYPDRKISDAVRDESLNKHGIKVYRIKWKNPNNEKNKEYIKNEIKKFLEFCEEKSFEEI